MAPTRTLFVLIAITLLVLPAWGAAALAQDTTARVRVDGREVFHVTGDDGVAASDRARRIEARLQLLLQRDATGSVTVTPGPDQTQIVGVGGAPIVTVTAADAEDNLTTPPVLARQWATALERAVGESRLRRLSWGGRFGSEVQGSIETAFAGLMRSAVSIVPRAFAALLVVAAFWVLAKTLRGGLRTALPLLVKDPTLNSLVRQLTYFGVIALGFAVAADALGFSPASVAAGLGLTGLVLGFALKDILSNFVSGVLLLALRPFEIGDQIVIADETEGTVERIQLRATQIRTYDGRVVLVPNAEVFTSKITNNTADPVRRGNATLNLGYDADLALAARIIPGEVAQADGVLEIPAPRVRISELGAAEVTLDVSFWTDSRRRDFQDTASAVRNRLVEALKRADIGLPNPDIRILKPASGGWGPLLAQAAETFGGETAVGKGSARSRTERPPGGDQDYVSHDAPPSARREPP